MNIGYWGGRSDSRGLARQAEGFANHLPLTRIMGIDMYAENLTPYPNDWERLSRHADLSVTKRCDITEELAKDWLRGLDVVLGAETFYSDPFCDWARECGVRTCLQINPEYQIWHLPPSRHIIHPSRPDILIAPTTWLLDQMPGVIHLPFPVDRIEFPFRARTRADHFVHTAGHRASHDRAGTRLVLATIRRLPRDINLTIRSQSEIGVSARSIRNPNVKVEIANLPDPLSLYMDADVVVLPRRYGGQHIGINEALSCGIPVITLNRPPENEWGGIVTIPARSRKFIRTHFGNLEWWDGNANMLADTMKRLHDDPAEVERLSYAANEYARGISWDALYPRYMDLFADTCA